LCVYTRPTKGPFCGLFRQPGPSASASFVEGAFINSSKAMGRGYGPSSTATYWSILLPLAHQQSFYIRQHSQISAPSPCRRSPSCSPAVPTPRMRRLRAVASPAVSAACEEENAEPPPACIFSGRADQPSVRDRETEGGRRRLRGTSAFAVRPILFVRASSSRILAEYSPPRIAPFHLLCNHPDPQHRPNPPCDVTREPGPQIPPARKTANACRAPCCPIGNLRATLTRSGLYSTQPTYLPSARRRYRHKTLADARLARAAISSSLIPAAQLRDREPNP
jgi:hypothetical protein